MNARQKSILLLAATLVLGVLLGLTGSSALQNRRTEQLRNTREISGMMRMIEKVIQVESETQRSEIRLVVEASGEQFQDARRTCSQLFQAHRDSMVTNLQAILSPAQQAELEQWLTLDHSGVRKRDGRGSRDGSRSGKHANRRDEQREH